MNNEYYIDLNINSVIPYYNENNIWIDPIDSLQSLYEDWYINFFEYTLGDINTDLNINILDIISLINGILNNNIYGIQFYISDINGDNSLNIQDLILLVNIILKRSDA